MVVVTRDRMVRNQVITLDEPVTQEELTSIGNYLNQRYSGHALSAVRHDLRARMEQASTAYYQMLRKLIVLYESCLSAAKLEPEVHLEGASNLVSFDFHLTRERLRAMFQTLEQKKRILLLLDRFLEPPSDELVYQIGLGEQDENLGELSLIGMSVELPGGLRGKIAVLGPIRMDYERALSAVRHVSRAFQTLDESA
jgi:heat-inducible transcriptional repressor